MITRKYFILPLLLISQIALFTSAAAQQMPPVKMPIALFPKLPTPGAMLDFPKQASGQYQPFIWNRMLDKESALGPFELKTVKLDNEKEFQWTLQTINLIGQGNPLTGQSLAKRYKCSKCHGETGISEENDTPSIAGQARPYAFKQMVEYKHKIRDDKMMFKKVRDLSYQDIADLAAWYEIQKLEDSVIRNTASKPPVLVSHGDPRRYLISCSACHGRWGEGIGFEAPAIAGQKAEHFISTMMAFKEGDRENDHYGRMRFITNQLTDEEIEQLAQYYGSITSLQEEE